MEQIKIYEKNGVNYNLLEVLGVLDSYNFTEFQQKAYSLIHEKHLVLDLSGLTSMDSSGLSVILGASIIGEELGTRLYIMNPSVGARKALDSTGFFDLLNIIHSVTEVR